MRLLITGHREEKLQNYDINWISTRISSLVAIEMRDYGVSLAYSGMASGVDLWFCKACVIHKLPYIACVPFDEQGERMSEESRIARDEYLKQAAQVMKVKNSWMVEHADRALVVWDGNKGGTHNVVQQLVEKNKPFVWINPVGQKVWHCS
jgi:uncharacterized phage-like protein YoqJ